MSKKLYDEHKGKKGVDLNTKTEGVVVGYLNDNSGYVIARVTKKGTGFLSEGWHGFTEDEDVIIDGSRTNELGFIYLESYEINN